MNKPDYSKDPNLSRVDEMNSGLFVIVIFRSETSVRRIPCRQPFTFIGV